MNDNITDEPAARVVATKLASLVRSTLDKPVGKSFNADTPAEAGKRYSVARRPSGSLPEGHHRDGTRQRVSCGHYNKGTIRCWKEEVVLDFKVESLEFKMKGDLEDSVVAAGEGKELAARLTRVFLWDIDFRTESKRGDTARFYSSADTLTIVLPDTGISFAPYIVVRGLARARKEALARRQPFCSMVSTLTTKAL